MELLFKRFFWVVPIVVVMLCSLIAAQAATHILAAAVLAPPAKAKARPPRLPKPAPELETRNKDDGAVATRNLFCSSCTPEAEKPVEATPQPAGPMSGGVPLTSAPIALVATLVASDPALSTATIVHKTTSMTGSYRAEDLIPTVGTVKKVRPNYVDFEAVGSKRLERIELTPSNGTAVAAAPTPPPPPSPLANPPPTPPVATPDTELLAEIDKGVKKIDDTHYEIDRALMDKVMNDTSLLARAARIVPSIQGGKNNGFKLYAIRPNSPFSKLGLQNGDTIQVVNGFEATGFDKALEVLGKVKSASNLSVQILRRGQPVTMEYTIK
jgi:general secretion pathway protein C